MQAAERSKLRPWCSRSGCARAFGEGKSRAACVFGCVRTCELGRDTRWEKARSRSIRSSRSGSRTLRRSWRASRDFWACWICSRWQSTVEARRFIWCGSTTCGREASELGGSRRKNDARGTRRLVRFFYWCLSTLMRCPSDVSYPSKLRE
jgi:hypothetical protein